MHEHNINTEDEYLIELLQSPEETEIILCKLICQAQMAMTEVPDDTDTQENDVLKIDEAETDQNEANKMNKTEAPLNDQQENNSEQQEMINQSSDIQTTEEIKGKNEEGQDSSSKTEIQNDCTDEIAKTADKDNSNTIEMQNDNTDETAKNDDMENSNITEIQNNDIVDETAKNEDKEISNVTKDNINETAKKKDKEISSVTEDNIDETARNEDKEISSITKDNIDETARNEDEENSNITEIQNGDNTDKTAKNEEKENSDATKIENSDETAKCKEKESSNATEIQSADETAKHEEGNESVNTTKIQNTDETAKFEEDNERITATNTQHIDETVKCAKDKEISNITEIQNDEETDKKKEIILAEMQKHPEFRKSKEAFIAIDIQKGPEVQEDREVKLQKEVTSLQGQLGQSKMLVRKLQSTLIIQQVESNNIVSGLKQQLQKNQDELKKQRLKYDRQLGEVISHLLFLEGQLKKEKKHINQVLKERDDIIEKQKTEIATLTNTNNRLLQAVREIYGRKGKNGVVQEGGTCTEDDRPSSPSLKDKDKAKTSDKGRFSSLKDKLRRHRSSLDLSEADININRGLINSRQFSSQENLLSIGKRNKEARAIRDKKCRSIAGYPDGTLADLILEVPDEHDQKSGFEGDENMGSDFDHWKQKYLITYGMSDSSPSQNGSTGAIHINGHSSNGLDEGSPAMLGGSMPILSQRDTNANLSPPKERPHSVSSFEHLHVNGDQTPPDKSPASSPTNTSFAEKNPFKNLKTILKRKGSKMKNNKKRTVSLSQPPHQHQDSMKKHFEKFDMS